MAVARINGTTAALFAAAAITVCPLFATEGLCGDRSGDANWCREPKIDEKQGSTGLSLPMGPMYQSTNFGFPNSTAALAKPMSLSLFVNGPPITASYSTVRPDSIPKEASSEPEPQAGKATTYIQTAFSGDWCTYSYELARVCASSGHCTYTRSQYTLVAPGR